MPFPRPHESIPLRDTSLSPPTSPREPTSAHGRQYQQQQRRLSSYAPSAQSAYPPSAAGSEGWHAQPRPSAGGTRSSYYAADARAGGYRDEIDEDDRRQQRQQQQGRPAARGARGSSSRWGEYDDEDDDDEYGAPEGREDDQDWDAYADFNNAGPRYAARPHLGPGIEGERFVANARNSRSSRPMSTFTSTPSVYGGLPVGGGQPIVSSASSGPNRLSSYSGGASVRQFDSNTSLLGSRGMYPEEKKVGGSASNMSDAQRQISELVTVPVLGADWKKSELHDLSRKGRNEERAARRSGKWNAFVRDEDRNRCCGRFSLRIVLVWSGFAAIVITALLLYFLIPRIPSFGFLTKQPFQAIDGATNTSDYISFSRTPANFDFNTTLLLQADTESTYIPVHMSAIDAKVFYIDEDKQVGTGHWEGTMPAKQLYDFKMPIRFQYEAINSSDATWLDFYDACGHIWTGTTRSSLKLRLELSLTATGRIGSQTTSTQISDIDCPYELPSNSA